MPALIALLLVLLLGAMAAAGFAAWLLRSEAGSAWLLAHVPGVEVRGVRGRLWGDFQAGHLAIALPDGTRIVADGLAWQGMTVEAGAGGRLLHASVDALRADRVELQPGKPTATPAPPRAPTDLGIPVDLEIGALEVGRFATPALGSKPLRDLRAQVHLGADGGSEHRIDRVSVTWDKVGMTGRAQIATSAPLALAAALQFHPADPDPSGWTAAASLSGTLAAPTLQATLRAQPRAERPAQSLDAQVTLKPFAAWPIGALHATARALDLSAFASAAPATTLDLDADATTSGTASPATVRMHLRNAQAGRWNEGLLPVRELTLEIGGRPDDLSAFDLKSLVAELGNAQAGSAGRVAGTGHWTRAHWNVDLTLDALRPELLDARAPALQLTGPLALDGTDPMQPDRLEVGITAKLDGRWNGPGPKRALQLALDGRATPLRIELRQLRAAAGAAHADLAGTLARSDAHAPWKVDAKTTLVDFDPAAWWPGRPGTAWRAGPHRLNAQGMARIDLPADPGALAPLALLAALRGDAEVNLANSVLAGVPLKGRVAWHNDGAGAPLIDIDAAGNTLHADGRVAIDRQGAGDRWNVQIDAPALDRLAPLAGLFQPLQRSADGFGGSLQLTAQAHGRWPAMTTHGRLEAHALKFGAARVQGAEGQWQLATRTDAPAEASLTITQASMPNGAAPGPSIETLHAQLTGTGRDHRVVLDAESKALPPAWTDALLPVDAAASAPVRPVALNAAALPPGRAASGPPPKAGPGSERTLAHVVLQGGLIDLPNQPLAGWRGRVPEALVRSSRDGKAPLLVLHDLALATQWGGRAQLDIQPGRADVLGAALTWSRIAWQAADAAGPARIDADIELQPLTIAPILARLQPDFGWGGDLQVAGHARVHSAPSFNADIVIERRSGDLGVTDETGTATALGLSDLRFGVAAADGTWSFTQALAGSTLGVAAGAVVARAGPQALWPASDAPLQGVLELQVANLGTWGRWVPAGWRLEGALHASAAIAGRFGAPEYTGRVDGTGLGVRNFLLGVDVGGGDVAIALQGAEARIERFMAKAGNGTVKLDGDATFGAAPKAELHVVADHFQLLGRVDRRVVTSGEARLVLDAERIGLDGRFGVDEGLIDFTRSDAPKLGDDVVVTHGEPAAVAPAASEQEPQAAPPGRKVAVDLRVDLGNKLRVRGRGLDAGLAGELHITSPEGRMAVDGTVRAVDGTYAAYGQKLQIDRGLITFAGSTDNPRLDIEATRPNTDVRVGVIVSGTTLNPRVRLFSEPDMSDVDKLSWLVMGRASDGLGRTDTALLQRAALALLSGENSGPTDRLTKAIGLDDISLHQSEGEVKETVVSLGKQLSRRWYVGYERGLNATGGSWQLIYRVARRFTLRAQAGEDNSLDAIWTWRWQ
ncbi:MAG: translocation/assembly module TamB domain-containing protein [Proteobacteria bacterium]|nr:translocation/assembly module TamB domain-containing protein [Pseudomonadota bacterium]